MMYEMLSGKLPFDADDAVKVALKQITDTPRPLAEIAPGTPKALVQITEKAMAKLPANRYASAREMLDALGQYIHDPDVVFAYKYITEEAPEKVVKQTMSQRKDPPRRHVRRPFHPKAEEKAHRLPPLAAGDHGGLCGGLRPAVPDDPAQRQQLHLGPEG